VPLLRLHPGGQELLEFGVRPTNGVNPRRTSVSKRLRSAAVAQCIHRHRGGFAFTGMGPKACHIKASLAIAMRGSAPDSLAVPSAASGCQVRGIPWLYSPCGAFDAPDDDSPVFQQPHLKRHAHWRCTTSP